MCFHSSIELDDLLPFIIEKYREALAAEGVAVLLLDREPSIWVSSGNSDFNLGREPCK